MKTSLFLPLTLGLLCTGCTLAPLPTDIPATTEESPVTEISMMTTASDTTVSGANPDEAPSNKPATPDNNAPQTTISTEELTKELDAFVDAITKGL